MGHFLFVFLHYPVYCKVTKLRKLKVNFNSRDDVLIFFILLRRGFWDLWDLMLYKTNAINPSRPNFQLAVIFFVLVSQMFSLETRSKNEAFKISKVQEFTSLFQLNSFVLVCWPLQVSRSLLSSPLQVIQEKKVLKSLTQTRIDS